MLSNAPAVYVPIQPEGNGLTLPTILSLLAHSVVIGLLIYNYQNTEIQTAGSIETVMVSPEQLAEMQGQILANRAAAADGAQNDSGFSGAISSEPLHPNDSSTPNSSTPYSQQVPVFMRSDNLPDEPMLMSQEYHQRLQEQYRDYERERAEWSAQQDDATMERLERIEQDKQNNIEETNERLKELRVKQNNPPKIERPTSSDRNIEINTGSSSSAGKNFSLADGQSTISGDTTTSSTSKGSASSSSNSASANEIKALIKANLKSPKGVKGKTALTTLTITVNSSGVIIDINASGNDPLFDKAIEQAARDTKRLPIGPDDPKYPTFTIEYIGTTK